MLFELRFILLFKSVLFKLHHQSAFQESPGGLGKALISGPHTCEYVGLKFTGGDADAAGPWSSTS